MTYRGSRNPGSYEDLGVGRVGESRLRLLLERGTGRLFTADPRGDPYSNPEKWKRIQDPEPAIRAL